MRLPKHIGVIPDGNRRWAKEHGFNKEDGYSYGLDCGLRFLRAASSRGIKEITYYGFTVDNCKRPKEQVEAFTKACCDAVQLIAKEDVALFVVGKTDSACFPKALLPFTKRREKTGEKTTRVNFFGQLRLGMGHQKRTVIARHSPNRPRYPLRRYVPSFRLFAGADRVFGYLRP